MQRESLMGCKTLFKIPPLCGEQVKGGYFAACAIFCELRLSVTNQWQSPLFLLICNNLSCPSSQHPLFFRNKGKEVVCIGMTQWGIEKAVESAGSSNDPDPSPALPQDDILIQQQMQLAIPQLQPVQHIPDVDSANRVESQYGIVSYYK